MNRFNVGWPIVVGTVLVVLAGSGLAPGASGGAESRVRYTLTVNFVGEEWQRPAGGYRRTVYVAKTAEPFSLQRWDSSAGPKFRFEAKVAGSLAHTARDPGGCTETPRVHTVGGAVTVVPLVSARQSPAPLAIAIKPPLLVHTVLRACTTERGEKVETYAELLPQHPRWHGYLTSVETAPVDLAAKFGKAFTVTYNTRHTYISWPRRYRWTLSFVPVEQVEAQRWRIEIAGADRWSWGRTATLGGGAWVDWTHATDLEIEGSRVEARSKVSVTNVTPFSTPDGVFDVTNLRSKTYRAYTSKATKQGSRVALRLLNELGSFYRVDFTVKLGPRALERMREAGVPDPEAMIESIRRPVTVTEISPVPFRPNVAVKLEPGLYETETDAFTSQLPCAKSASKKECFLQRGGERIVVRRLR